MSPTTTRRWPPLKTVLLGSLALALGAGAVFGVVMGVCALTGGDGPSTASLKAWDLPGLRIGMPDWEVREASESAPPGVIRVVDAGSDGRFMEARWEAGLSLSTETLVRVVDQALRETASETVQVDGRPAQLLRFGAEGSDREVALSTWICPATGLGAYLLSAHTAGDQGPLDTFRRVLATVDCAPVGHGERPDPIYPEFFPPEGYKTVDATGSMVWEGPDKDLFVVLQGSPGKRRTAALAADEKMRAQLLRAELGLKDIHFDADPRPLRKSTDKREVWRATAQDGGGNKVRALMTYWHCADSDLGFAAVHVGPLNQAIEPPTDTLTGAVCPPRPQP